MITRLERTLMLFRALCISVTIAISTDRGLQPRPGKVEFPPSGCPRSPWHPHSRCRMTPASRPPVNTTQPSVRQRLPKGSRAADSSAEVARAARAHHPDNRQCPAASPSIVCRNKKLSPAKACDRSSHCSSAWSSLSPECFTGTANTCGLNTGSAPDAATRRPTSGINLSQLSQDRPVQNVLYVAQPLCTYAPSSTRWS